MPVPRGRKRVLRLDPVVVDSMCTDVKNKRARTMTQLAKATGVLAPTTATQQPQLKMADYLWTGSRVFDGATQLAMTFDMSCCSREETLAIGIFSGQLNKCMWLPPQVIHIAGHLSLAQRSRAGGTCRGPRT